MKKNKKFIYFKLFLKFENKIRQVLQLESFLKNKLFGQFKLDGYDEMGVPILERGIFYSRKYVEFSAMDEESMFKFDVIDYNKNCKKIVKTKKGILIPESTLQIYRLLFHLIAKKKENYIIFKKNAKNALEKDKKLRNMLNQNNVYFQDENIKNSGPMQKEKKDLVLEI